MIAEKKIKSGPLLEADFYPAFQDGRRMPARSHKSKLSSEAQAKYNRTQAIKKIVHMVNANFDGDDYFMHPTYEPGFAPATLKEARRDISNYFRRVNRTRITALKRITAELKELPVIPSLKDLRKRLKHQQKVLKKPFKYYYWVERSIYKTGKRKGQPSYHFHIFLTGGLDGKQLESMWPSGLRTNANHFQPDKFGPEAAAEYACKDTQGERTSAHSRNMENPDISPPKPAGISPAGVERWAKQRVDDAAFWERKYKGYKFVRCYPRYNSYNGYWYISVFMYRSGDSPPWKGDDLGEQFY